MVDLVVIITIIIIDFLPPIVYKIFEKELNVKKGNFTSGV